MRSYLRGALRSAVLAASILGTYTVALGADVGQGLSQGQGGYYDPTDRSGPYAVGPDGTRRLLGSNPAAAQTSTGALAPPTAPAGKITKTSTSIPANTSTTIAAANENRIGYGVQCAAGSVAIDETGGALTGAVLGQGTLFIPGNPNAYFTPPVATTTAITAYTSTAQVCVVTEYNR